jgi:hypothetical protein
MNADAILNDNRNKTWQGGQSFAAARPHDNYGAHGLSRHSRATAEVTRPA